MERTLGRVEKRSPGFLSRALPALLIRLLIAVLPLCAASCEKKELPEKRASIRNIILITIDTLRPDALSVYDGRIPTPFLQEFASGAVVFDNAFTSAPITLPAHTSLLTGLYPPGHGVRHNGTFRAPSSLTLLSEIARENGMATGAVVAGFPLAAQFGLNQGFDLYDDRFRSGPKDPGVFQYAEKSAEEVRHSAEEWLSHQTTSFFLWLHFFDPHHPYLEHGYPSTAPYQQEVLYVDAQLRILFDFLRARGLDREALIVITSDHGEAFGEHQEISHSLFVYNTTIRIPLIISAPGLNPERKKEIVRIIDIAPTICDWMQWPIPLNIEGVSLVPLLDGKTWTPLDAYSESLAPAIDFGWSPLLSLQDRNGKYIQAPRPEFYRTDSDPGEDRNLYGQYDVSKYAERLTRVTRKQTSAPAHTPSVEERERLQSFGYFSTPSSTIRMTGPDPKDRVETARKIAELSVHPLPLNEKAEAYRIIVASEPDNSLLLLRYAEVLLQTRKDQEAERVFTRVIDLGYPSAAAYNGLAALRFRQNRPSDARDLLKKAESLGLADGETYYNLGEFAFDAGDAAGAFKYYEHSIAFGFLEAYFRAARLKDVQGDTPSALEFLRQAQDRSPDNPRVHFERAMIYSRHEAFDSAIHELQRVLQLKPDDPAAYYNIGLAFVRTGKTDEARSHLQEFLRIAPREWTEERRSAETLLRQMSN